MENIELNVMVGSLKAQISVLEARIKKIGRLTESKRLSDFYGVLAEFGPTTEEDIDAVKLRLKEPPL